MKKLALFFNSAYLGGAERSFIHQTAELKESYQLTFFIPYLDSTKEAKKLTSLLSKAGHSFERVIYFQYPKEIYNVSRSGGLFSLLKGIVYIPKGLMVLRSLNLHQYDIWWMNGNKIGLLLFIWAKVGLFRKKILWHFRDYPAESSVYKYLWPCLGIKNTFELRLIGNSHSVRDALKRLAPSLDVLTIYNPVGEKIKRKVKSGRDKKIGVVSMFAPWKGIHEVIIMASIYEAELRELGVSEISIYGGSLYKTKGGHEGYEEELFKLVSKLNCKLVKFKGLQGPSEIFDDINYLIHSSIRPEPFGRVIVEAFQAGVAVISTAQGGARELIGSDDNRGESYTPGNYEELFRSIKKTIEKGPFSEKVEEAFEFSLMLGPLVQEQIKEALNFS